MGQNGPGRERCPRSVCGLLVAASASALLLAGCGDPRSGASVSQPNPARAEALAPIPDSQWVRLVRTLSEAGGYFDTDNLISNETSYLHVVGPMTRLGVRGGVYVGVGPDQNFSYMAAQRPSLAFVLDIRRDNLLHHLMHKALFHETDRRVEYLALLLGRAVPDDSLWDRSATGDIAQLLRAVEAFPGGAGSPQAADSWRRIRSRMERFGLPLSPDDLSTVERFHRTFVDAGSGLRFTSHGRLPRPYYPTYGQLLAETDLDGEAGSYLATEEAFRFVDALQEANRVVPVVGDLAGPTALRAIGAEAEQRGLTVRLLYTSNVEYYLMREGRFPRFAASAATLPVDRWSVLVRSVFPTAVRHPHSVPGYYSTQTLVRLEDFRSVLSGGGYTGYGDLVTRQAVPLLPPDPGRRRAVPGGGG
jgi:hypothetical protein